MLKRLFLVIFILQSFATSAWAGVDMSQFNQAEKSQMQIMHSAMSMEGMQTMLSSDSSNASHQMECSACDQETECLNILCSSIHAATPFYAQIAMNQSSPLIVSHLIATLTASVQYSNSQPETPPPAI